MISHTEPTMEYAMTRRLSRIAFGTFVTASFGVAVWASASCYRLSSACTPGTGGQFCSPGTVVCKTGYTASGHPGQPGNSGPVNVSETRYCGTYEDYVTAPCVDEDVEAYPGAYTGCEALDGGGNPTGVCCYGVGAFHISGPSAGTMLAPSGGPCTN
jgi:hypothetical protein